MSAPAATATRFEPAARGLLTPPGGILVWLVVFLELLTFGIGLAVFVHLKAGEPAVFEAGQAGLSAGTALANTLLLLTGGWLMANALVRLRAGATARARRDLMAAALCGVGFLGLKGWEYAGKLGQGHGLHQDTFHTLYWLLGGFHYLHVAVAVVLLAAMAWHLRGGACSAELREHIEGSAVFWHLCDLIWLLLVPVIYLVR